MTAVALVTLSSVCDSCYLKIQFGFVPRKNMQREANGRGSAKTKQTSYFLPLLLKALCHCKDSASHFPTLGGDGASV